MSSRLSLDGWKKIKGTRRRREKKTLLSSFFGGLFEKAVLIGVVEAKAKTVLGTITRALSFFSPSH